MKVTGGLPFALLERPLRWVLKPLAFLSMDGRVVDFTIPPSTVCSTVVVTGRLFTRLTELPRARATGAHPILSNSM